MQILLCGAAGQGVYELGSFRKSTPFFLLGWRLVVGSISSDEEADLIWLLLCLFSQGTRWDVMDPPGPRATVSLETESGTWLSVDVHPDGSWLVFDLMGDLYRLPIHGGEAQSLTSGMAWDMQPRFSPDGKAIVFTSDRGGGDNVWVMDADGGNPRAISAEPFRLLNNPVWSPDGQYVAARKHFTSRRSLGAGEIWLYHVSGGKGVQLVARPNDQKDLGEPAFSPDGRYVYYSQDTTPGRIFQYSKDPNPGIYTIQRFDRETGDIDAVVSGLGGAVRPTPSPDGKQLAFVRRVRYATHLFVKDLQSGAERQLVGGLDRDMQETWAIHGVYPGMAWLPDNSGLVLWKQGSLVRVNAADGSEQVIPFRVKDQRDVTPALRFPVAVAPDAFDVKMLRWVTTSPQGDRVVFQALGYLYVMDLPTGKPKRLTGQNEHFEYFPSWSPDGKTIVYTSWHDKELGAVRAVPAAGGKSRLLVSDKGHYAKPVVSPDGKTVVFRRLDGGYLRTGLWSNDAGLYRVNFKGGPAQSLDVDGDHPQFGADSEHVFYMAWDNGKRALKSVRLTSGDARVHATTEHAGDYAVSPDGRWLAWQERFHVYITPMPAVGGPRSLSPKGDGLPVARVTQDAGDFIHWSGDSERLYWSLGPTLYQQPLTEAFAFLNGDSETVAAPPLEGASLGFKAPYAKPEGVLAFTNATILPMDGQRTVIENGTVVVEGNRIKAVGPAGSVTVPQAAKVIDVGGRVLMPGWIDVHFHGRQATDHMQPQRNWLHDATLAFGVTTVHDPSHNTHDIFSSSELAKAGRIVAPRIYSTGTILYGAGGPSKAEIDGLEDARRHLRRMKAVGAFSVKSYNQPRRDQRQQVIAAARELEMMVVAEGGSLFQHNMSMLMDGHTGIEHSIPVAAAYGDVLTLWPQTRVGYTPTLVVAFGGSWGENYWYEHTNVWENERLMRFVPNRLIEARSRRRPKIPAEEYNHIDNARVCKQLFDRGVRVNLGAHGQREGLGAHWEVWMLVQGGMSAHEALYSASASGAEYLGLDDDVGSLAAGKLADFIVFETDPREDIRRSEHIRYTVLNGVVYDAATMNPLDGPERSPVFWWDQAVGGVKQPPPFRTCCSRP